MIDKGRWPRKKTMLVSKSISYREVKQIEPYLLTTYSFSSFEDPERGLIIVDILPRKHLNPNIPLAGGFGIAPGLYYSMITNKSGSTGTILGIPVSASSTFMEHAVNVPLYLNYNLNLASDSNFFIFAGPTAQYGLASTTKLAGGVGEYSGDKKYDNYDNENYNRFNVYLGGGVGFQVSAIQITVGYDYGLMNLYKGENAIKTHRSNLKLGLGFVF